MALVTRSPPSAGVVAAIPSSGISLGMFPRAPGRTPKSLYLGPAALLTWWIFSVVARFGMLISQLDNPSAALGSELIFIPVSAVVLLCFNLWLLVAPRSFCEASPVWEAVLVTAMLVFARAGSTLEKVFSLKRSNSFNTLGVEPVREGAVPLLYVLLVCRLPNDLRAVGFVTAAYLIASAILELHNLTESREFQLSTFAWQEGIGLVVLAILAVVRRHWYSVRDQKSSIWSRLALLAWFTHVIVQFSVMVDVSVSSDNAWLIFAVGALLAVAGAICMGNLWLFFYAQLQNRKCAELLCVLGGLLFALSLGVVERQLFDQDVPQTVDVNVHGGPLAMLHVLLICKIPTAGSVAAAAAGLYAVAHTAIAFVDENVAQQQAVLAIMAVFVALRRCSENSGRLPGVPAVPAPAAVPPSPLPSDAPAAMPGSSGSSPSLPAAASSSSAASAPIAFADPCPTVSRATPDLRPSTESRVSPTDHSEESEAEVDEEETSTWSSYSSPSEPPSDTERPCTLAVPSTVDVSSALADACAQDSPNLCTDAFLEVAGDRPTQPPPRSSPKWCPQIAGGVPRSTSRAFSSTEVMPVDGSSELRLQSQSKSLQVVTAEQSMLMAQVERQRAAVQVLRTQLIRTREELRASQGETVQRKRQLRRMQRQYNELRRSSGNQSLERKLAYRQGRRLGELGLQDLQALDEELDEALAAVKGQLRAELERKTKCQVCLELDTNCAFAACGHQACTTCASQLEVCHICRTPIQDIVILYN